MKWKNILFFILCFYVFFNVLSIFNDNSSNIVNAQPVLTIDETQVDKQRVDIRDQAIFAIHIVRTSDGFPLQFGDVTFQNRPGVWKTDYYGWCLVPVTSWDVGNFSLVIDEIHLGTSQLSFQYDVPNSWCVFDQILVDLKISEPRIGVNTEVPIRWTATYAFDGAPFEGQIILNENLTSSTLGSRTYQVIEIIDDLYGLSEFQSDPLEIIFDRVLVTLNASDERVNVGSEAEIQWIAIYEYDQTPFHGWIEFNNTLIQDEAGKFSYTVRYVGDAKYDVAAFSSNIVDVIFDEVTVKIRAEDKRINVGEEAEISIHARYGYNSEPFEGELTLNRDDFKSNTVGSKIYFVEGMEDPVYGLSAFSSDELEIIWDRIDLEIEAEDNRINIGEDVVLQYSGIYEWDGSEFYGEIELSPGIFTYDSVCEVEYQISRVIDPIYDITSFSANKVEVVWDRIDVSIGFPSERTKIGTEPEIFIAAFYEYDGRTFSGNIHLNDTLNKNHLGKHGFTVSSIEDTKYGITSYVSNEESCIWDRIVMEKNINSFIPGTVQISFKLFYEYDGKPVENAYINVNGKTCQEIEAGTYVLRLINLLPVVSMHARIDRPGFTNEFSLGLQLSLGNVGMIIVIIAASVAFIARKKLVKKMITHEKTGL